MAKLAELAKECIPVTERIKRMAALVKETGAKVDRQELVEFSKYNDMDVRLAH